MKLRFLKLKNWLLGALLGTLGLGSCHSAKPVTVIEPEPAQPQTPQVQPDSTTRRRPDPRNEAVLMYGVPTTTFQVSGRVLSPKGKPVEGVQVLLLDDDMEATPDTIYGNPDLISRFVESEAVHTDSEGLFAVMRRRLPRGPMRILVRDVDGKRNGLYKNQIIELEDKANQTVDVKLERK